MSKGTGTGKIVAGCFGLSLGTILCGLTLILIFAFTSCSFNRYIIARDLPRPDKAFVTGTVFGYNVYLWDCYQGKHIALYNSTGELYMGPFKREEVQCGEQTEIEKIMATERVVRPVDPSNW